MKTIEELAREYAKTISEEHAEMRWCDASELEKYLYDACIFISNSQQLVIDQLRDEIEELKKANEWISVDERLPEDGSEIDCKMVDPRGNVVYYVAGYCDGKYYLLDMGIWGKCITDKDQPTHWKPIK